MRYDSIDEIKDFIDDIVENKIEEIHKNGKNESDFIFKSNNTWYNIYVGDLVGTTFKFGKSLILTKSFDAIKWEVIAFHQNPQKEALFDYLNKFKNYYKEYLLYNNTSISNISISFCELFNEIETIEKYDDNLFILRKKNDSISFSRNTIYKSSENKRINKLIIMKNDKLICYENEDKLSIFKFLDSYYNISKLYNSNEIVKFLIEYINK